MLMYKDNGLAILQIEELEHMPTANRRRWMRDYMKEYRQGKLRRGVVSRHLHPARVEKLKTVHRLNSFKWRLSKLLSPQYEILTCMQYLPEYGVFKTDDGLILGFDEEFCYNNNEVLDAFPVLKKFKRNFDAGGGELFKAFLFRTHSRRFDRVTECVVGVLDKAALLENLQQLPSQSGRRWEIVWKKVKNEARQGTWRKLDFSRNPQLWIQRYTECYSLKWTARNRPRWNSSALHIRLCGWAIGVRRIGRGVWDEWSIAESKGARKLILSPIVWHDEIWCDEIVRVMKSLV
jgi:hypothetical protein